MVGIGAVAAANGVVEIDVSGYGSGTALQVDGFDLVQITDVTPEEGTARLTVYASSAERSPVLWAGTVDLTGHLREVGDGGRGDAVSHIGCSATNASRTRQLSACNFTLTGDFLGTGSRDMYAYTGPCSR